MKKIKNLLCIALCLLMLVSLLPLCAAAQEEEKIMIGVGFVTMPYQQLYSEPSSQSQTLAVTNENDCVVVIEQINDSWYLVNHNLQEGYMYADALDIRTEVHAELGKGRINSDIVYMRTGPGTEYSIFISGYQDREFTIIGMFNGWYKVLGKKQTHSVYSTCYVRSDLMDLAEIPYQNEASENTPAYFYLGQEIGEIDYKEQDQVAMAAPALTTSPSAAAICWPRPRIIWVFPMSSAVIPLKALTVPDLYTTSSKRRAILFPGLLQTSTIWAMQFPVISWPPVIWYFLKTPIPAESPMWVFMPAAANLSTHQPTAAVCAMAASAAIGQIITAAHDASVNSLSRHPSDAGISYF